MSITITPNWRRFAAIAFDADLAAVISALDVEVPPEGRPRVFHAHGWYANRTIEDTWTVCDGQRSYFVASPGEVLRELKLPAGTPSGDALRMWLRMWGWVPGSGQAPAEPPPPPMVV